MSANSVQRRGASMFATVLALIVSAPAQAQTRVTWKGAVASALRHNPAHRMAVAEVEIARKRDDAAKHYV